MYLYFFQLQAFGSSEALISAWENRIRFICFKLSEHFYDFPTFKLTTRFLLQVFDSDGEFGWQWERAGLSGEGLHPCGDRGPSFGRFDPDWQVGKTPGWREPPTSSWSLQQKQRKCCHELETQQRAKVNTVKMAALVLTHKQARLEKKAGNLSQFSRMRFQTSP